ncbi:hypothetical protein, partial [Frankia sp. CIT1]|uniref:hypothetical protein n=1 Tax=Frankia sp. CIT1 TaxID=2880974 RepID=UPI001EF6152F
TEERGRAPVRRLVASGCSPDAEATRGPGWSKIPRELGSPPRAAYTLVCSSSHRHGVPDDRREL